MTTFNKSIRTTLAMTALLALLVGCDRQEGPAEQAGKDIDQATQKAGEKIEEMGENIRDAIQSNKP